MSAGGYHSLRAATLATRCEFTPTLARRHYFVQGRNGRWFRTLDASPEGAIRIRGRVYRMSKAAQS